MKDVATHAKTSVATVSKSLRDIPTIPEETRERIKYIAHQLGYRPHPYLSALMRSRRKRVPTITTCPVLAYITAHPTENGWRKEAFFVALFEGARDRAVMRGYILQPLWLYWDNMSNDRFSTILSARGIRGLMFNPFPRFGMEVHLEWNKFSVVAHGLSLASPVFHRTSDDHYQSMMSVMEECAVRGYKRPGFALEAATSKRLELRWEAAFQISVERSGLELRIPPLMLSSPWEPDQLCEWIRRERPDVVITLMLEDQVKDLIKRGVRIPGEVGLVSLSVAYSGSPLSGVFQNPAAMGAVAVEQLINMVERNETGVPEYPITLTLRSQWNAGRTLRRISGRSKRRGREVPDRR